MPPGQRKRMIRSGWISAAPQLQSDDDDENVLVYDAAAANSVRGSSMRSIRRTVERRSRLMSPSEADSCYANILPRDPLSRRNSASVSNRNGGDAARVSGIARYENIRVVNVDSDVDSSSVGSPAQMLRVSEPAGCSEAEAAVKKPNSGMLRIPDISDDDCFRGFRRINFGCETEFLLPESDGSNNLNRSNEVEFFDDDDDAEVEEAKRLQKLKDEFACSICLDVCYEPCTVSCSHTFCKSCLIDSIRACGSRCPKCRGELNLAGQEVLVNTMIWNSIQLLFPEECAERKRAMDEEKALEEQHQEQWRFVRRRSTEEDVTNQWLQLNSLSQEFLVELGLRPSIRLGQRRSHDGSSGAARSSSSSDGQWFQSSSPLTPVFLTPVSRASAATPVMTRPWRRTARMNAGGQRRRQQG